MIDRSGRSELSPQIEISDDDIYEAMKDIPGYLDATPGDLKELYRAAFRHATNRIMTSVKARDIMTADVITVKKDTPLKDVADEMAKSGVSGVPVTDERGAVIGVVSGKDFLAHMGNGDVKNFMSIVAECLKGEGCLALQIRRQSAGDIMTSPAVTVTEFSSVLEIADLFTKKQINRVPVVDADGRIVGIVSRADIVRASGIGPGARK